jgi:hypothetical protein
VQDKPVIEHQGTNACVGLPHTSGVQTSADQCQRSPARFASTSAGALARADVAPVLVGTETLIIIRAVGLRLFTRYTVLRNEINSTTMLNGVIECYIELVVRVAGAKCPWAGQQAAGLMPACHEGGKCNKGSAQCCTQKEGTVGGAVKHPTAAQWEASCAHDAATWGLAGGAEATAAVPPTAMACLPACEQQNSLASRQAPSAGASSNSLFLQTEPRGRSWGITSGARRGGLGAGGGPAPYARRPPAHVKRDQTGYVRLWQAVL